MPRQDQETRVLLELETEPWGWQRALVWGGGGHEAQNEVQVGGGQQATPRLQVLASRTWSRVHRPSDGRRLEKVLTFRPEGVDQA